MKLANVKNARNCAFCKHWYDPTNNCIKPKNSVSGFWEFDNSATNKCLKTNTNRASWTSCGSYECKV